MLKNAEDIPQEIALLWPRALGEGSLKVSAIHCNKTSLSVSVATNKVGHSAVPQHQGEHLSKKTRLLKDAAHSSVATDVYGRTRTTTHSRLRRVAGVIATTAVALTTGLVTSVPSMADEPLVTVPGSHNSEMGCSEDWQADCADAELTLRADGIYEGTFTLPEGNYEYKVAIGGTWDENYGANGVAGGPNVTYSHDGGAIRFFYDPRSNIFSNTAAGPVITLPGSFQAALGCSGDWQPDCLATLMQDGDGDGIYEFSTDQLPEGNYEVKAAHGENWDESYGPADNRGGNYTFAVAQGELVSFSYDIATHILDIDVANPPLAGTGQLGAQWVSANTIAWPRTLLSGGDPAALKWTLYAAETPGLPLDDDDITEIPLTYRSSGLSADELARFPHLAGSIALTVDDGQNRAALRSLVTQQLQIQQVNGGEPTALTGVQLPGILDDLYADALASETLGVTWKNNGDERFALWAPTARNVTLLLWPPGGSGQPTRVNATFDDTSGVWSAQTDVAQGAEYLWEVEVYAHSTRTVETNVVTDPYSHALTMDSQRSVAIDLSSDQWMPDQWVETPQPKIEKAVDRAIYELHIRDFSIGDESVPAAERGTYRAFTRDGAGARQLRELAEAGITTVHLLPSFDIATIGEDRTAHATPNCDLASFAPNSEQQQACVGAIRGADGFNWGYDPFHYTTPEGSYAVDPNGGARVAEYREMVGALHNMGLEVVLDQVFNHTAQSGQSDKSVLDRIVPGYYHRLSGTGSVETSTCCENIATEFAAAEKLMIDSVVTWARDYKIDGFRFDLMGHHSRDNMLAVRSALDELTLAKDGVDGSAIYLYGEGWDFGEVAGDARFVQARQGNLGGTGIGTFNDRLRDGVHGGSPVASNTIQQQGYGTGLGTDPNGAPINGSTEDALAALGPATDLVKVGLAGNLKDFTFLASDGELRRGSEIDYNGSPAGYAEQPDEIVNYVDAHDNETLYDLAVLKLPQETSMPDRVRMNTLMLGTATLSQGVSFWHAGTELLRSKSLDRNSYDSGDWFNRIDWTGQESTFGSGLPMAADNQDKWSIMAPLLADPALKPTAADIAQAEGAALDLLRVRAEVELLRLGDADLIKQKVSFPNGGPDATPGVIVMLIDDLIGADVDPGLAGALVVFNASPEGITETLPDLAGRNFALTPALANGSDSVVRQTSWNVQAGSVTVPARTVAVLVEPQQQSGGNTDLDEEDNTTPDSGTRPDVDDSDEPSDTTQQTGDEATDSVEAPDEAADRLSDTGMSPATWGAAVFSTLLIAFGGAFLVLRRRHTVE